MSGYTDETIVHHGVLRREHYQFVKVETILNHPRKRRTSFPRTYNVIPANAGIQSIDIYLHTSHAIRSSSLLSVLISMPFSIF